MNVRSDFFIGEDEVLRFCKYTCFQSSESCIFGQSRARARVQTNFEEVHVLVQVEVVGLKKFLGYVNDRDVNPDLSHYLELVLN